MNRRSLLILVILLIMLTLMVGGCSHKTIPAERIAITSLPKLDYLKGETFDLNNAKITVYYTDGRSVTYPLTFEMISDYDPQELGEHILSIRYENVSENIKIKISNAPIVRVEPVQGLQPYKVSYIESQSLDVTNLKLKIHYESGEPDIVAVTEDMITGFDSEIIGEQELTIKYLNKYNTKLTVLVKKKEVKSISLAEIPDKKLYLIDEQITFESLSGGRLFVSYDNGFTEYINFENLFETQEDLDAALSYSTEINQKEIVRLNYKNKYVIFEIIVLEKEAETFQILQNPTEVQIVGTNLSLRGGQLLIEYNNKTEAVVNMTDDKVSASGYDKTIIGMQTITLAFTDIRKTFSFPIEVIETKPMELQILLPVVEDNNIVRYSQATGTEKVFADFYEEGTIDLELWEYRLKMDNGTYSAIYTVEESMLSGEITDLNLDTYGLHSLSFKYNRDTINLIATEEINVIKKTLDRITVTPPTNSIFYMKSDLILTGATFTAYFNDGSSFTENISRDMVSGFKNSQEGYQDVNVTYATESYGEKISTFKVLVIRKAINIQFESLPKTVYVLGESFDIDGLVMRIHYEGIGASDLFSGPFGDEWTFTNTVFNQEGNVEVNVGYQAVGLSLSTTIPVKVKNDLVSIELLKQVGEQYEAVESFPEVVVGMNLDITSLFIKATLENGIRMVPLTANMTNYERQYKATGIRAININYGGKIILSSVNVVEREIASLELLSQPERKYYKAMVPANIDIEGLRLRISFTNDTNKLLNVNNLLQQNSDNLIYRFINEELENEDIMLSITVLDTTLNVGTEMEIKNIVVEINGFSINFDVVVAYKIATDITWDISNDNEPEVAQPEIIAYQGIDEITFPTGASFKVIYNDGEFSEIINVSDVINDIEIIGFSYNISGVQVVEIRYQDIRLSTIIKVNKKDLLSIALMPDFYVPDITEGLALDLRQAKIRVTYYHDMGTGDPADNIILPSATVSVSAGMIDYNKNNNMLGTRNITITYSYSGNTIVVKNDYFNVTVKEKQLVKIGMGVIPQTKYVELDQYSYEGGTIIVYYDNDTTATLNLADAKRVADPSQIMPTDTYVLNHGQFDNSDFTGFSRKQQIFIKYREGNVSSQTSYDIIMHDRLNAKVVFALSEDFNETYNTYYYGYGEDRDIQYQIQGYSEHSDQVENLTIAEMNLEKGINYTFKYINVSTGEEFASWPKDVGTYTIYIHYNADASINNDRIHNSFVHSTRSIVITPKNIHIAPNNITKVYGENNPLFSSTISAIEYREMIGGEIETIYHTDNVFGYNEDASILGAINYTCIDNSNAQVWKKSSIGTYLINVSIVSNRNYNVTFGEANFVIAKRAITIIADSKTKEYGQSDPAFTHKTAAVIGDDKSGLIQGDNFSGYLLRQNASGNNGVGSYTISLGSLNNNNYEVHFVENSLTITKRRLVLITKNFTKIYGQNMPILSVDASSDRETPFAYADTISILGGNLVFTCLDNLGNNVTVSTNAGVYDIIPSGLTSNNYAIEYVNGSITINRRPINIIAVTNEKIYGTSTDPVLNYTTHNVTDIIESGLFASDVLNGSLQRDVGEAVGTYNINQGEIHNSNNPNYDIIFVGNVFNITKRAAQIEITKLSRQYNGELPSIKNNEYILHNASGDIKNNIEITFINPSKNVGTYSIEFVNNDTNHTLTFYSESGYLFLITQKEVSTIFYNIPYGTLEDGEYTGSVFKGSNYYYESRVANDDVCLGDSVDVVIHTAEILSEDSIPFYMEKNNVLNVGKYSVKVVSLTNYNYKLKVQTEDDIIVNGDYKLADFSIIPAIIKVYIKNYSKSFSGGNVIFNNSLIKIGNFYESLDYKLLTELNFEPQGLNVYPYFINDNGIERPPSFVQYLQDEQGAYIKDDDNNFIITGYSMRAVTGNKNYKATLVDIAGNELARDDEGEIEEEEYRFKILPLTIDVDLLLSGVTKNYDAQPPNISPDKFNLKNAQVNKETEVYFEFARINEVPEFMREVIKDKDNGLFSIMPFTTNMNYRLKLSDDKKYNYEIKKVLLYSCDLGILSKQYDGLKPKVLNQSLNFSNYSQSYIDEEREDITINLNFSGLEMFNVGTYPFTVEFLFPKTNPQKHSGYEDHLDYNHKFVDVAWLSKTYTIQRRSVKIEILDSDVEGYNWKYYNGLAGAILNDSVDLFSRGFIIVDSKAYDESEIENMNMVVDGFLHNGEQRRKKHMLNEESDILLKDEILGNLTLENIITTAPRETNIMTTEITQNPNNSNFNIIQDAMSSKFAIKRQLVYYHFDLVTRPYGETLTKDQFKFALAPSEREKVVEGGTTESLFAEGGLFSLSHFNPIAMGVTNKSPVGYYSIMCDDVRFDWNYELKFDATASSNNFQILKRELPVSYVNDRGSFTTITRVYGDPIANVIYNFELSTEYGKGLTSWDDAAGLIYSAEFDKPSIQFIDNVGNIMDTDVGIIDSLAVEIDFSYGGTNENYIFTYDNFKIEEVLTQPKLEIIKAKLIAKITNNDYNGTNDPSIYAIYGQPPTYGDGYKYDYDGLKLGQTPETVAINDLNFYILPATTVVIDGETVSFDAITIDLDMSSYSLLDIIYTNLSLEVMWNEVMNICAPHFIVPSLRYQGTISRKATNGSYYNFTPVNTINLSLKNYDFVVDETDYTVMKRNIDVWLELLHDSSNKDDATFDILWDEVPTIITEEMILFRQYSKEDLLLSRIEVGQIVSTILNTKQMLDRIVEIAMATKQDILIWADIEGAEEMNETEINLAYDELTENEITAALVGMGLGETEMKLIYDSFSQVEKDLAYDTFVTSSMLASIFAEKDYSESELDIIYQEIISTLSNDEKRLVYRYRYEVEQLVYGDTISEDSSSKINISNINLNYDIARGENKHITAMGITGNNYHYNYIQSNLNIYRYVVSLGFDNQLPNVMVSGDDEFIVRVNFVDGSFEYMSFKNPQDTIYYIRDDFSCNFDYNMAINMSLMNTNQDIQITYSEQFFGYKDFVISSDIFQTRVFKVGDDKLLWGKDVDLANNYKGGTFISSNGNKSIAEKIDGNYDYFISTFEGESITKAKYEFDIIDASFRLSPKAGMQDYYFKIIIDEMIDEANEINKSLALKFSSGSTEMFSLIGVIDGETAFELNSLKPGELDIFDGRSHQIKIYIDKLGTRESIAEGYSVLVVIDNGFYYSFSIGKDYIFEDISPTGFESNNCFAWISKYNVYQQGLESARGIIALPTTEAFYAQSYAITTTSKTLMLKELVTAYTLKRSSYIEVNKDTSHYTYEMKLNGDEITDNNAPNTLYAGIYFLDADIYYHDVYMDSVQILISVSRNYTYEKLSDSVTNQTPYMAQPRTYYGYTYGEDDMTIGNTQKKTINATNLKNYRYSKQVFNLGFASLTGGQYPSVEMPEGYEASSPNNWQYPYSAAIILKTTNINADLRDPTITATSFNGIGMFIRYDGTDYYTKVFMRVNANLYYSADFININWSNVQRTIVETSFDEKTGEINITVINDGQITVLKFGSGTSMLSGQTLSTYDLLPIITNENSTTSIILNNTKIKIFQMETGVRNIYNNNYVNYRTGDFVINEGNNSFSSGDQIFMDNGLGYAQASNYSEYSITFSATAENNESTNSDFFRFLIATNKPSFDNNPFDNNRGFYIGYEKIPDTENSYYAMYLGIYKRGMKYVHQYIGTTRETVLGLPIISNIMDGMEHTISVRIGKNVLSITDPDYGIFTCGPDNPMLIYEIRIFIDDIEMGTGHIPVENNLSDWRPGPGGTTSGSSNYGEFLPSNMYAGLDVINAFMKVSLFNAL